MNSLASMIGVNSQTMKIAHLPSPGEERRIRQFPSCIKSIQDFTPETLKHGTEYTSDAMVFKIP